MSAHAVRIRPDTYVDSVLLMAASRTMRAGEGVEWAAAVMGTEANLEDLKGEGFPAGDLGKGGANDLVLAVRAASEEQADEALQEGEGSLQEGVAGGPGQEQKPPRTLERAADSLDGANVAIVSVPGEHAALEAHKALSRGLHVLLFSDNVTLDDEVVLKQRARELGLLVMGPGAGTAVLGGVGLGFANVVEPGRVGIVAAAGTGAQEVMSLVDRWGAGVSHVVGVGGRDLSQRVGGTMARSAVKALEEDPGTEVILLVSKPPAPDVAAALLENLGEKPTVVALVGLEDPPSAPEGVRVCRSMEEVGAAALEILELGSPDVTEGLSDLIAGALDRPGDDRRAVKGLFSGGTLCYESMVVMTPRLGAVHSNVPLRDGWGMPAPADAHVCLDLGEEEYTKGRPHPMIDPEPRAEMILNAGEDPACAVILIDVVLGYGAHDDPASVLALACEQATSKPGGACVVAYVLGTDNDPQGYSSQRARLQDAGCLLAPTGAHAALMAAAVAARNPKVVHERP